jgi:hypothetical protein
MSDSRVLISFDGKPAYFFSSLNSRARFDSMNFIDNVGSFLYYLMIIAFLVILMLAFKLISMQYP